MNAFSTSASITTSSQGALQKALLILTNNGFAILSRDESSASLSGPGLNSTSQNPLLGASKIHVVEDGSKLRLDAELGGAEHLQRFIKSIPWATGFGAAFLHASMGVLFGWQFGVGFGIPGASGWIWLMITFCIATGVALPWIFISPWLAKSIRTKTEQALKNLVQNAVQLSKST